MNFIGAVYWMCVWVEKKRKIFKENVQKGIKAEFVQFVKTIGLGWVIMDAHNVLIMIISTAFSS